LENPGATEIISKIHAADGHHAFFSHFIEDGEKISHEFSRYLEKHIQYIQELEMVLKTYNEFTHEIVLSLFNYFKRAVPALKVLEVLTGPLAEEAWQMLSGLMEKMRWMVRAVGIIKQNKEKLFNWLQVAKTADSMEEFLQDLSAAIEEKEVVQAVGALKSLISSAEKLLDALEVSMATACCR